MFVICGDPIYTAISLKYGRNLDNQAIYNESKRYMSITILTFLFSVIAFYASFYYYTRNVLSSTVCALFITLITGSLVLSIYQAKNDRSSLYMYGITGTDLTIEFIRKNYLATNSQINIMPSEIAYYLDRKRRFYDVDNLMQIGLTKNVFDNINPDIFVLRNHNWGDNDRLKLLLPVLNSNQFKSEYQFKQIGGYQIYLKKANKL